MGLFKYFSVRMSHLDRHSGPDLQIVTGYNRKMSTGTILMCLKKCHQVFVLIRTCSAASYNKTNKKTNGKQGQ